MTVPPRSLRERRFVIQALFVLYVEDQARSVEFFRRVLQRAPVLDEPGMTEFDLGAGSRLGLMPHSSVRRLLGIRTQSPQAAAELYLYVDSPEQFHASAVAAGAEELSPLLPRDWGDEAAYSRTSDGHVLAFARRNAARP